MPPEAVIVFVPVVKLMASVPVPVTFVLDDSRPVPLIVPPERLIPAESVSWVMPAPSSFSVLAPTASVLVRVRAAEVFSSRICPLVPLKVNEVAALAASSCSPPLPVDQRAAVGDRRGDLQRTAIRFDRCRAGRADGAGDLAETGDRAAGER